MSGNPNMLPKETSASYCRRMGWGPGAHIVGDEGCGPTAITITAVGAPEGCRVGRMHPRLGGVPVRHLRQRATTQPLPAGAVMPDHLRKNP